MLRFFLRAGADGTSLPYFSYEHLRAVSAIRLVRAISINGAIDLDANRFHAVTRLFTTPLTDGFINVVLGTPKDLADLHTVGKTNIGLTSFYEPRHPLDHERKIFEKYDFVGGITFEDAVHLKCSYLPPVSDAWSRLLSMFHER